MSVERHLREAMLKTALNNLLKNREHSPDRTARNIQELLLRFDPAHAFKSFTYEELLSAIQSANCDDCVEWIIGHLS